jgi:hypothetical protein
MCATRLSLQLMMMLLLLLLLVICSAAAVLANSPDASPCTGHL